MPRSRAACRISAGRVSIPGQPVWTLPECPGPLVLLLGEEETVVGANPVNTTVGQRRPQRLTVVVVSQWWAAEEPMPVRAIQDGVSQQEVLRARLERGWLPRLRAYRESSAEALGAREMKYPEPSAGCRDDATSTGNRLGFDERRLQLRKEAARTSVSSLHALKAHLLQGAVFSVDTDGRAELRSSLGDAVQRRVVDHEAAAAIGHVELERADSLANDLCKLVKHGVGRLAHHRVETEIDDGGSLGLCTSCCAALRAATLVPRSRNQ